MAIHTKNECVTTLVFQVIKFHMTFAKAVLRKRELETLVILVPPDLSVSTSALEQLVRIRHRNTQQLFTGVVGMLRIFDMRGSNSGAGRVSAIDVAIKFF